MTKDDFDKFVERQQTKKIADTSIDWAAERDEWLRLLDSLYESIESFIASYKSAGTANYRFDNIMLNEEDIGEYPARQMILKFGRQEVSFTPIGTRLVGTKGRVDVRGPAGKATLLLINKEVSTVKQLIKVTVVTPDEMTKATFPKIENEKPLERVWKIASPPPDMRFTDLTQEAFFEMVLEVVNA